MSFPGLQDRVKNSGLSLMFQDGWHLCSTCPSSSLKWSSQLLPSVVANRIPGIPRAPVYARILLYKFCSVSRWKTCFGELLTAVFECPKIATRICTLFCICTDSRHNFWTTDLYTVGCDPPFPPTMLFPAGSSLELDVLMIFMTFTVFCGWRLVWYSCVPRPFLFALFEVKGRHKLVLGGGGGGGGGGTPLQDTYLFTGVVSVTLSFHPNIIYICSLGMKAQIFL